MSETLKPVFRARICAVFNDKPEIYLYEEDILKLLNADAVVVYVESGGKDEPEGNCQMSLECHNKDNGYYFKMLPLAKK